jgi:hypothetical protein
MILVYRPELLNPPMDKEAFWGFSFLQKEGLPNYFCLSAGVNREVPDTVWAGIQDYAEVKTALQIGALRIETAESTVVEEQVETEASDSLAAFPLETALRLIEDSFDLEQLSKWDAKDQRIKVKNAIARRKTAITSGNG